MDTVRKLQQLAMETLEKEKQEMEAKIECVGSAAQHYVFEHFVLVFIQYCLLHPIVANNFCSFPLSGGLRGSSAKPTLI